MTGLRTFVRDRSGASAAEFALVLPLFIVLLLGVIDAGRLLWELNTIRKAAQVGARMTAVTDPVAGGLTSASYVGIDPGTGVLLGQGDVIPASALGRIDCDDTQCTCTTGPCPGLGTYDATIFDTIVARMANHYSGIADTNVVISYMGSGLGFAGDPNGPDISPTIEVSISGLQFTPITSLLFATVNLPTIRTSMTGEDQDGSASY